MEDVTATSNLERRIKLKDHGQDCYDLSKRHSVLPCLSTVRDTGVRTI